MSHRQWDIVIKKKERKRKQNMVKRGKGKGVDAVRSTTLMRGD